MLCSICHEHSSSYIQITCSHNICINCLSQKGFHEKSRLEFYQCNICLQIYHDINLNQFIKKDNLTKQEAKIYCQTCKKFLGASDFVTEDHNEHQFLSLQEAIPLIKTYLKEDLQKGLGLEASLQQRNNFYDIDFMNKEQEKAIQQVENYFKRVEHYILVKKQQIMQTLREKCYFRRNQIQQNKKNIQKISQRVKKMNLEMQQILKDKISLEEIENLNQINSILKENLDYTLKRETLMPKVPDFIFLTNLQQEIQTSCFLKYDQRNQQTEQNFIEEDKRYSYSEKKVNLVDKMKQLLQIN